jgi:hypothetical protein
VYDKVNVYVKRYVQSMHCDTPTQMHITRYACGTIQPRSCSKMSEEQLNSNDCGKVFVAGIS